MFMNNQMVQCISFTGILTVLVSFIINRLTMLSILALRPCKIFGIPDFDFNKMFKISSAINYLESVMDQKRCNNDTYDDSQPLLSDVLNKN